MDRPNIRNATRRLRTARHDHYKELVSRMSDEGSDTNYPFEYGFELFSAGLVIGYMNENDDLINEAAQSGTFEHEETTKEIVSFQLVIENNPEHAYTIELMDRLIAMHLASELDDSSIPEDVWSLVIAHSDLGVGIIRQEWKENREIDIPQRIDAAKEFWAKKTADFRSLITQLPDRSGYGIIDPDS